MWIGWSAKQEPATLWAPEALSQTQTHFSSSRRQTELATEPWSVAQY